MAKRKTTVRIGIGLAVLAVVLGVFAWQQGDDSSSSGPLNAIAAAAEKTQGEPGGRAKIRAVVSAPSEDPITMKGRSVFDEWGRTWAVMRVPNPETGETIAIEMIIDESSMYMFMRSDVFDDLPDGKDWMGLDLSFGGELEMTGPSNGDVKGELEMLEAATGVRKLGREEVRGVPTTLYGGTVDADEQVERYREEGADDIADYLEEEGTPLELEVWIDDKGLVRRMRMVGSEPAADGEGTTTMDMRVDFFDFGITPDIDLPAAGEVFDMTPFAETGLDS